MIVFDVLPLEVCYLFLLGALFQGFKQNIDRNSETRPERKEYKVVSYFYNSHKSIVHVPIFFSFL